MFLVLNVDFEFWTVARPVRNDGRSDARQFAAYVLIIGPTLTFTGLMQSAVRPKWGT